MFLQVLSRSVASQCLIKECLLRKKFWGSCTQNQKSAHLGKLRLLVPNWLVKRLKKAELYAKKGENARFDSKPVFGGEKAGNQRN